MSLILAIAGALHPQPSIVFTTVNLGTSLSAGVAFSGQATAENRGGATGTITYSATGLPAGISINTSTGVITGTPSTPGSFSATITASNGTQSTQQGWAGTVAAAPFSLSGTLSSNATVGSAYSSTLTLGGTFVAPVTISAQTGTIPAWMTVSVSGATVTFSGTPTGAETDSFTPQATDSSATPQVAVGSAQSITVSAASSGPTIVQWAALPNPPQPSGGSMVLPAAPTVGNTLIRLYASPNYVPPTVPSGWALAASSGGTSAAGYFAAVYTRTVVAGDGTSWPSLAGTSFETMLEAQGSATAAIANAAIVTRQNTGTTLVGGAAQSVASIPVAVAFSSAASPNSAYAWPSGWTGNGPVNVTSYPYGGQGVGYMAATTSAVAAPTITYSGTRGNGSAVVCMLAYIQGA